MQGRKRAEATPFFERLWLGMTSLTEKRRGFVGWAKAPMRRAHHLWSLSNGGHANALPTLRPRLPPSFRDAA
jgi:hypothetical protein